MKNSYRINFAANTLTVSKAFEEAAHDPFSDEYKIVYENADALLAQFELVRRQSQKAASPYSYVLAWFNKQFPNHKDILEKSEEKAKIISLPAVKIVELLPASGE